MRKKSIISMMIVIIILLVTKMSGLMRDAVVVSQYGASHFSDGFFVALSIVLTLYALVGKAVTLYLIPKFNRSEADYALIKAFIIKGSFIALAFIGLYSFCSGFFIQLLYNGLIDETIRRLFSDAVYASIWVPLIYALVAYHQSYQRFYRTTLIGFLFNIMVMAGILFFNTHSLLFFLAMLTQVLLLIKDIDLEKLKYAPVAKIEFRSLYTIGMISFVMAFEQLHVLIDRKYISLMGDGELTLLDLGGKVSFMFMGIIVMGITTVIYPKLVLHYNEKKYQALLNLFYKATFLLMLSSALCILGLVFFGQEIIEILFVRGRLYSGTSGTIALYLKIYALALLPLAVREMMVRFMILRKKEVVLLGTSVVGIILNISISKTANSPTQVVFVSVMSIVISTVLLGIAFVIEMRKYKNESR
ncbi:MAG: hypothetical protein JXQ26_08720 [Tissierellales bacterium]|nr:hypothetical protein [Tissierellales bacterium]